MDYYMMILTQIHHSMVGLLVVLAGVLVQYRGLAQWRALSIT